MVWCEWNPKEKRERESRGDGYCVWMNVIRQKANLSERLVKGRGTCTTPRDWWKLAASFWFFSENNKSMRIQSIHTITSIQLYSLMLSSIHTQLLHKQPSLSLSHYISFIILFTLLASYNYDPLISFYICGEFAFSVLFISFNLNFLVRGLLSINKR